MVRGTGTLLRKGLEAGEMKGNYQTALNIHNRKRDKGRKEEIGAGAGNQPRCLCLNFTSFHIHFSILLRFC